MPKKKDMTEQKIKLDIPNHDGIGRSGRDNPKSEHFFWKRRLRIFLCINKKKTMDRENITIGSSVMNQ